MTKKRDFEKELLEAGWTKLRGAGAKHDKLRKGERIVMVPLYKELRGGAACEIRKEVGLANLSHPTQSGK